MVISGEGALHDNLRICCECKKRKKREFMFDVSAFKYQGDRFVCISCLEDNKQKVDSGEQDKYPRLSNLKELKQV
jgi:recombinational DNA repair protein (RecF pathway)